MVNSKSLFEANMRRIRDLVESVNDPLVRAQNASALLEEHTAAVNQLASLRRGAVAELVRQGMSYSSIAAALGLSKAMVQKLAGESFRDMLAAGVNARVSSSAHLRLPPTQICSR